MNIPENSPLGRETDYPEQYDPSLLYAIPRANSRQLLGITSELPFFGKDIWTAFELSWLNTKGKPLVAIGELSFPCDSPSIIESKSLKLYLNSLNQDRFASLDAVAARLTNDLSTAAGATVAVRLDPPESSQYQPGSREGFQCIDDLDITVDEFAYQPDTLSSRPEGTGPQAYVSHLLRSNCPVTGQPDWASIFIECDGPLLDPASLLRYLTGFRQHQEFHEQCVERIFIDLLRLGLRELTVNARYLRRGGLDINPVRSTTSNYPIIGRTLRQ